MLLLIQSKLVIRQGYVLQKYHEYRMYEYWTEIYLGYVPNINKLNIIFK